MRTKISRHRFVFLAALLAVFLTLPSLAWAATGNGADINGDGVVNLADLGLFAQLFFAGGYQAAIDIDCNGVIDLADVGAFVAAF